MSNHTRSPSPKIELAKLLISFPAESRSAVLRSAASFLPEPTLDRSMQIGRIRVALADCWEQQFETPIPVKALRVVLTPPHSIQCVLALSQFDRPMNTEEMQEAIVDLLCTLRQSTPVRAKIDQLSLFRAEPSKEQVIAKPAVGTTTSNLDELITAGRKFPTIYADPPWQYANRSSRAAAENHYPTLSLDEICSEPVSELVEENAHLHLWTTNGFLREAFDVIEAWGFTYKSCFVWVKDTIGMGNYWRVSHEYLLLGVRGSLTFLNRNQPSWIQAQRTIHSRKPGIVRTLIEQVSPAPYLELYGREELPNSAWTVYGNRIESRLF